MIKRMIALLLVCLCCVTGARAGGIEIRLTVKDSDILSDGAERALAQWLEKAYLAVSAAEGSQTAALQHGEKTLAAAISTQEAAALAAGDLAADLPLDSFSVREAFSQATQRAEQLGELLREYEKSDRATAELGGAVKAKTQLSYALSSEQWAQVWPQVQDIAGEELPQCTLESKGTLRRYFDAQGCEIGAYFYAAKVRFAQDDVREVRLEYAFSPDEGLYLAFRCPNARETRNLRISVTAKRTERSDRTNYSFSGDVRRWHDGDQDTLTAEISLKEADGILSGKAKANYTKKRGDHTGKYALTAEPVWEGESGRIGFVFESGGDMWLEGEITCAAAQVQDMALPVINASYAEVTGALAVALLWSVQDIPDSDRLELLYYLNRPAYLTGDEKAVYPDYDPEFTVTEE